MVGMTEADVSIAPPEPRKRRRLAPWIAGLVAFTVTVVIGSALAVDWSWRTSEMRDLLDRVEASEAIMIELQDGVEKAFENHTSGSDPSTLDSELRDLAATAAVEIAAAGAQVAVLPIASWHADITRARDAYLVHNQAWVQYMTRASQSSAEFVRPQPQVNESFFAAEGLFRAAIPLPDLWDIRSRVGAIFAIPDEFRADQVAV